MKKKAKEKKEVKVPTNISMKPSVRKIGEDKAYKKRVSLSQLIEIMIYDFNAE